MVSTAFNLHYVNCICCTTKGFLVHAMQLVASKLPVKFVLCQDLITLSCANRLLAFDLNPFKKIIVKQKIQIPWPVFRMFKQLYEIIPRLNQFFKS